MTILEAGLYNATFKRVVQSGQEVTCKGGGADHDAPHHKHSNSSVEGEVADRGSNPNLPISSKDSQEQGTHGNSDSHNRETLRPEHHR